jgi:hypothetical protein
MRLNNESHELELIANARQIVSKEVGCQGFANALPREVPGRCGAARDRILPAEGKLLARAHARFSCERAELFTLQLRTGEFRFAAGLRGRQETVVPARVHRKKGRIVF